MKDIFEILAFATIVTFVMESLKGLYDVQFTGGKVRLYLLRALPIALGALFAVYGGQSLFNSVGLPMDAQWLDIAVTGLAIGLGSNKLHDLIKNINGIKSEDFEDYEIVEEDLSDSDYDVIEEEAYRVHSAYWDLEDK